MKLNDNLIDRVRAYIAAGRLRRMPGWREAEPYYLQPLAQGEYNVNYLLEQAQRRWVFRVNMGTQIGRDDQIHYEYQALKLLENSGVTPLGVHVDDNRDIVPNGLLVMSYLQGGPLDYTRDLRAVANVFAAIHKLDVEPADNHLIVEEHPLSMTYNECAGLLRVYIESGLAQSELKSWFVELLEWAAEKTSTESYFGSDPVRCIVNTEVNSGNFICDREQGKTWLVDWEKPLWGDPSADLSHFCAPMTTLWKTSWRMQEREKREFLKDYAAAVGDAHLADTIAERVSVRDPFTYLRGISWSAMAWVQYQTGEHAVRNEETFRKVESYLDLSFLKGLFTKFGAPV